MDFSRKPIPTMIIILYNAIVAVFPTSAETAERSELNGTVYSRSDDFIFRVHYTFLPSLHRDTWRAFVV